MATYPNSVNFRVAIFISQLPTLNRYHTAYTKHTNTMSGTSNLEERLTQLQGAQERPAPDHACPRIQRVAHHLRDRKHLTKHYTPKLVSMGPIHHGEPKLRLGEHYKQMWASTYILNKKITPKTLHKDVEANIDYLKGPFGDDLYSNFINYHNQGFASMDEMISWTLFVDGCALLQILEHAKLEKPEKMNVKVDQLVLVMQDVLLMENQLPYPLLKLLWRGQEGKLIEIMIDYLKCHHWADPNHEKLTGQLKNQPEPFHLLDLQRNIILHDAREGNPTPNNQTNGKSNGMVTYRYIPRTHACV
ncbi:hypothetical protein Fmac_001022 [Flemingia macrophylla]|uniref:Uncharacterized protein n=1 Tax=Flemingia macrophylla TaxID=520843 RepID=A0ABD1NFX4_9FABA